MKKIFVIAADGSTRQTLIGLLLEAGYEVSAPENGQQNLQAVLGFQPHLLLLEAEPARLDCCHLISSLKASPAGECTRVMLLATGGPAERTRGLDLGADDVVSHPWDPGELLARIRTQLRVQRAQAEGQDSREELSTDRAALPAAAIETIARHSSYLPREFKLTLAAVFLAALILATTLVMIGTSRRSQKDTRRVYSAIAKLQAGLLQEHELIERTHRAGQEMAQSSGFSGQLQRQQLQRQAEELRARMASADSEEVSALRDRLAQTTERIHRLENQSKIAQAIIQSYAPSVCLLHVVVAFKDQATGRRLHYEGLDAHGEPLKDKDDTTSLSVDGKGPEVRLYAVGTGFLSATGGRILTNHHVVEPWWNESEFQALVQQGIEPVVAEMTAYFPGIAQGTPVRVLKVSAEADLAVVQGDLGDRKLKLLPLAERAGEVVSGQSVVLLGYATGLDAILARAGEQTLRDIVSSSPTTPQEIMAGLARRGFIRPVNTQGHIGEVLPDRIVYDAQTSSGGSGGPLFNIEGKVIGVNYAMLTGFGGSNFAIPIRLARKLLSE